MVNPLDWNFKFPAVGFTDRAEVMAVQQEKNEDEAAFLSLCASFCGFAGLRARRS